MFHRFIRAALWLATASAVALLTFGSTPSHAAAKGGNDWEFRPVAQIAALVPDYTDTGGTLNDQHKSCSDNLNNCLWIHTNGAYDVWQGSPYRHQFRFARLWSSDMVSGYPAQFVDANGICDLYDGSTGYGVTTNKSITFPGDSIKLGPDAGSDQVRSGLDGNFICHVTVDWANGNSDHFNLYGHMN